MITSILTAVEYLNPHQPLIDKFMDEFKNEWFSSSQVLWNIAPWNFFQKNDWLGTHTCYIHGKRIEYKIDWNNINLLEIDLSLKLWKLESIRNNFYTYDEQKIKSLTWLVLQVTDTISQLDKDLLLKECDLNVKLIDRQINYLKEINDCLLNFNIYIWVNLDSSTINATIDINDRYTDTKNFLNEIIVAAQALISKDDLLLLLLNGKRDD